MEYVVQNVTLGNYAKKTIKKIRKKTVKMAPNSIFLGLH